MDIIRAIEQQQIKQDVPEFNVGDNVKVHYRITEGNRERIQAVSYTHLSCWRSWGSRRFSARFWAQRP